MKREQVNKYDEQCKNGFEFDVEKYSCTQDKTLIKEINIDDETLIQAILKYSWCEHGYVPTLRIRKGYTDGRYCTFSGSSQWIDMGKPQKSKKINLLIKLTENITDNYILSMCDNKI